MEKKNDLFISQDLFLWLLCFFLLVSSRQEYCFWLLIPNLIIPVTPIFMWAAGKWKQWNVSRSCKGGKYEYDSLLSTATTWNRQGSGSTLSSQMPKHWSPFQYITGKFPGSCPSLPSYSKKVLISLVIWFPCPSSWKKWIRKGRRTD